MAFFPRGFVGSDSPSSFAPLFRLLDDFDEYNSASRPQKAHLKTFQPKFDVKELSDSYELHGELAGVEQKDVDIEFTDPQTITIRGRTEREYSSGTPPAAIESAPNGGAITEAGETHKAPPKPTVEDETASAQASTAAVQQGQKSVTPAKPEARYWVSERSIGEFHRSFSFPTRVDQNAVRASMKNGILSVIVPKAKKHETRKIAIS
ncbi:MAG: hypothetical protein M1818_001005 [Claussenomyces sp. TS43310]|nr:MAG: hypothetical protein M1818_001005 [Claussenomyces sp. TS43310]